MSVKLKKPNAQLNKRENVNRKAVYWLVGIALALVVIISTLLILNV